jgi:hypothetical protein
MFAKPACIIRRKNKPGKNGFNLAKLLNEFSS